MKLSKRTACVLYLIFIFIIQFSACTEGLPGEQNNKAVEEDNKGTIVNTSSPITLDFYINYHWWPKTKVEWGNDLASKEITRITGVTLKIEKPANNDESMTRLNMMLSTGDLPDIVMADDGVLNKKLIQKGMFIPLNEMIDKYGSDITANIGWDYLKEFCTEQDGNIYGLPQGANFRDQIPDSGGGVLVLKGLYERLGEPPLNTPEDVYKYLVSVRDSGLKTRDGEAYIPSTFDWPTQDLSGMYGVRFYSVDSGSFIYGEDNKLRHVIRVPEMKEIFRFTSRLFREKLIDQEWLLQDEASVFKKLISGRIAMYFPTNAFGWLDEYNDRLKNSAEDSYMLVETPLASGVENPKYNLVKKSPWSRIYITSGCKDPERAIKFLNWLSSETGQYISRIGPEGAVWTREIGGKPAVTSEFAEKLASGRDSALNEIGYYKWCFMQNNKFTESAVRALMMPEERKERQARADIITKSLWYAPELEGLKIDPASKAGIASTRINSYFSKMDRKIFMAQTDEEFEKLYSAVLPELKKLGIDVVENELNSQIAENLKK